MCSCCRSCWHAVKKVKGRSRTDLKWCSASQRKLMMPCTCLCWMVGKHARTHPPGRRSRSFYGNSPSFAVTSWRANLQKRLTRRCNSSTLQRSLLHFSFSPSPACRIRWEHWLPGRTDTAGVIPGLGSQDFDPEGTRPAPLSLWDVSGLQQGSQRLQRAQQVPVQEQALCKSHPASPREEKHSSLLMSYSNWAKHEIYQGLCANANNTMSACPILNRCWHQNSVHFWKIAIINCLPI